MVDYNPITYQEGDFVTVEKQNQEQSNIQYLYENQIDGKYQYGSVVKSGGLKMLAGSIVLPAAPTEDHTHGTVYFGNFFTPGCLPIVTATPMIKVGSRISVVVRGIDRQEVTSTGFTATVCQFETARPNVIKKSLRVNYIAIGY